MKLGKKIIGGALLATSGALLGLTLLGTAQADWTGPDGGGDGETSSSVSTNLWCTWYVNGVDGDIALAPEVAGTEYEGAALELSGSVMDQEALVAGWVDGASPTIDTQGDYDCSWYNAHKGLTVTVTSAGTGFAATAETGGPDDQMDFSLAQGPIAVTYTENPDNACSADWTLAAGLTIDSDADSVDAAEIGYSNTMSKTESCSWDTSYGVTIPAGKSPRYPGQNYTFVGPTLTTAVEFIDAPPAP